MSLSFPHQSTHFTMPTCKNVNLHPSTILARCNLLKLLERRVQEEIISWKGSAQRLSGSRGSYSPRCPRQGHEKSGAGAAPEPNAPAETMQPGLGHPQEQNNETEEKVKRSFQAEPQLSPSGQVNRGKQSSRAAFGPAALAPAQEQHPCLPTSPGDSWVCTQHKTLLSASR